MPKYTVDNIIRLKSPVNISEPGGGKFNPETNRWSYASSTEGFPGKRTKSIQVALPAADNTAGEDGPGVQRLPILPGNSLRGELRRCAAKLVIDAIVARGEIITFDLFHILMCGAASASPDGSTSIGFATRAMRNPMAALFGGGPQMIWSRYSTGIGFPINAQTIDLGFVPPSMGIYSAGNGRLTATAMDVRVDDILRGNSNAPSAIANLDNEIIRWVESISDGKEARAEAKKNKAQKGAEINPTAAQRPLQSLTATEYLLPGLSFYSKDTLDTDLTGAALLGLYVLMRVASANNNRLGGCRRNGFGHFSITSICRRSDGASFELMQENDGIYAANLAEDEVREAVNAWQEWAQSSCSAASVAEAFSLPKDAQNPAVAVPTAETAEGVTATTTK